MTWTWTTVDGKPTAPPSPQYGPPDWGPDDEQENDMDATIDVKTQSLSRACADALKKFPRQQEEISLARQWIEAGAVVPDPDDNAYEVDGRRLDAAHCSCPYGTGPLLCAHRFAIMIQRRSLRYWQEAERQEATGLPPARGPVPKTSQDAPPSTNGTPQDPRAMLAPVQHPTPILARQSAKEAAIARGEALVARAYDITPAAYHPYLIVLDRRQNFGTKERPDWAVVRSPYLTVAGRVALARDAHDGHESMTMQTAYHQLGTQWVCAAHIVSPRHGTVTAHATVQIGGAGADATNPWENAETSAIGRALGLLGYGLFAEGLASADDMQEAE